MMAEAGTSIAFHAKPVVRRQATYALNRTGLEGVLALFP
jgi:phosphoserine phosphatase